MQSRLRPEPRRPVRPAAAGRRRDQADPEGSAAAARRRRHRCSTCAPILVFIPAMLLFAVIPVGAEHGLRRPQRRRALPPRAVVARRRWRSSSPAGPRTTSTRCFGAMRVIAMVDQLRDPARAGAARRRALHRHDEPRRRSCTGRREHRRLARVPAAAAACSSTSSASTAELNRTPADIAEAESEIVAGYHTEYSGMKFGLFYAVELINALAVVRASSRRLFFGGWSLFGLEEWIPPWMIFIGKIYVFYFVFIWLRGTLPRLRIDQLHGLRLEVADAAGADQHRRRRRRGAASGTRRLDATRDRRRRGCWRSPSSTSRSSRRARRRLGARSSATGPAASPTRPRARARRRRATCPSLRAEAEPADGRARASSSRSGCSPALTLGCALMVALVSRNLVHAVLFLVAHVRRRRRPLHHCSRPTSSRWCRS